MLPKRDPITAQLQLMRLRGDHAKKEAMRLFHQSPMRRMQMDVRNRLDESLNYRLGVLRSVNVFGACCMMFTAMATLPIFSPLHSFLSGSFTDDLLRRVADNMEIATFVQGEDIFVQNDIGDAFYVIEMGRVKVMRKNNAYEVAHEIRQMGKGSFFGELSLLNEEPRSATITVVSETARALKLSKVMFDELVKVRFHARKGHTLHRVRPLTPTFPSRQQTRLRRGSGETFWGPISRTRCPSSSRCLPR